MILLIDNYDSFTYNLYQYISQLGRKVKVMRNDAIGLDDLDETVYSAIVISPGPGKPREAGISVEIIRRMAGKLPIFGVCLGHQAIVEAFGGTVIPAPQPVHGKVSQIYHNGVGIYHNLTNPFAAGRYHSLIASQYDLPDCLAITAKTEDNLIMSVEHKTFNIHGVQYHPESILTNQGMNVLQNFFRAIH